MAKDINQVVLTGRLTRDCSLKNSGEKYFCNNTIAVNGFKDGEASFIDITAFSKVAEIISNYCSKGSFVAITGNMKQERWSGKDGETKSKIIVIVESVKLLDTKKSSENSNLENPNKAEPKLDNSNSKSTPDWMEESVDEDIF